MAVAVIDSLARAATCVGAIIQQQQPLETCCQTAAACVSRRVPHARAYFRKINYDGAIMTDISLSR